MTHWSEQGLCRRQPDLWDGDWAYESVQAAHLCLKHCPVLAECRAASRDYRWLQVVVAGCWHGATGQIRAGSAAVNVCTRHCDLFMSMRKDGR